VAHDALVTVGLLSILQRPFDLTVVAAVLTIVGYSLNDTIVIFDRVRENLRLRRSPGSSEKLFNDSLNETLSRSILTSLTVLLVVISLYLFGGDRINDFAFAMLVGVVIGSYSTIYISCPFVLLWEAAQARRRLRAAA
jgi:preprotein translocase subunit SecF